MLLIFNNYGQLSFLFIYFIISKYYSIFNKIKISFNKNKNYTVILFNGSALFPSEWFPPSPAFFIVWTWIPISCLWRTVQPKSLQFTVDRARSIVDLKSLSNARTCPEHVWPISQV